MDWLAERDQTAALLTTPGEWDGRPREDRGTGCGMRLRVPLSPNERRARAPPSLTVVVIRSQIIVLSGGTSSIRR